MPWGTAGLLQVLYILQGVGDAAAAAAGPRRVQHLGPASQLLRIKLQEIR